MLLERESEATKIRDALAVAADGSGSVMLIQGPAGIGKTSMLALAGEIGVQSGTTVLTARGGVLEGDFSFGVVRQLLERTATDAQGRDLFDGVASLAAPVLDPRMTGGQAAAPLDPQAALHGLFWVCSNLSDQAPLLFIVDDAHWADPESLRFLLYLSRRIRDLPALLVMGRRPEEGETQPGVFAELLLEPAVDQLDVRPLSREAVATLVEHEYGTDPDPSFSEACHRATGGNPFFLFELLKALREDGVAPTAVAANRIQTLSPETVRISVAARLGRLPATAQRLARAVAVLEIDPGLHRAGALAGLEAAEAGEAVGELVRAGLLTTTEPFTFAHPIVRESVYAEIAGPERSRLHVRAAELLQTGGAEPDALAPHLLAVEPAEDAGVVAVLRESAATALARGTPEVAATLLGRALREPPPVELRRDLCFAFGRAELMAGLPDCTEHLRKALELSDVPAERAEVARALSAAALQGGDPSAGVPVLAEVIGEIGDSDRELRLTLEGDRVIAAILGDKQEHARLSRELESLASGLAGDSVAECTLLAALAYFRAASVGSTASGAIEAGRRAITGSRFADLSFDTSALANAIIALTDSEAYELAEREAVAARERCQAAGSLAGFGLHSDLMGNLRVYRGELLRAEAEATNALDAARLLGIQTGTHSTVAVLLNVMVERGNLAEAETLIEEFDRRGELPPLVTDHWLQESRARVRLAAGDHQRALDDLAKLRQTGVDWNITNPARIRWRSLSALAHHALGDADAAARLAAEELELAERFGARRAIGIALQAQGRVLGADAGIAALRRAAEVLDGSGADLELARARVELGAALRRAGKRIEAREQLAAGLDGASRCAATVLVERAREELHAAGARPRRERLSGLESLTARERSVAELAASGLSNREIARDLFVTLKTVEKHLGNVYMKLEIEKRTELPDALAGEQPAKK